MRTIIGDHLYDRRRKVNRGKYFSRIKGTIKLSTGAKTINLFKDQLNQMSTRKPKGQRVADLSRLARSIQPRWSLSSPQRLYACYVGLYLVSSVVISENIVTGVWPQISDESVGCSNNGHLVGLAA
jgi:hypothetical protein